jgi:nucleolar protein 9
MRRRLRVLYFFNLFSDFPSPIIRPSSRGTLFLHACFFAYDKFCHVSIQSLSIETLLHIAYNPTGSRVFDSLLDSPTVSRKDKCAFVMSFIGHFQSLVDDRIGSRIGDRCWMFADPYLRVCPTSSLEVFTQI